MGMAVTLPTRMVGIESMPAILSRLLSMRRICRVRLL